MFICPLCGEPLEENLKGLICNNNHNFDKSKDGYVNLLLNTRHNLYDNNALFTARRQAYEADFFKPIGKYINDVIKKDNEINLLEAGCGEGSLLNYLCQHNKSMNFIGMDISKIAIKKAAKTYKGIFWFVGDLCHIPLRDGKVKWIINMLAPANYDEFKRVLSEDGYLIKVVPNNNHLHEIRRLIGKEEHNLFNLDTINYLKSHALICENMRITYKVKCDKKLIESIYLMTPLTVNSDIDGLKNTNITSVTVDVQVLITKFQNQL